MFHPDSIKGLRKRPTRPQKWQTISPDVERNGRQGATIGAATGGEAMMAEVSGGLGVLSITFF
jgi:hypothetical protein